MPTRDICANDFCEKGPVVSKEIECGRRVHTLSWYLFRYFGDVSLSQNMFSLIQNSNGIHTNTLPPFQTKRTKRGLGAEGTQQGREGGSRINELVMIRKIEVAIPKFNSG